MRGINSNSINSFLMQTDNTQSSSDTVTTPTDTSGNSVLNDNMSLAQSPGSIFWALLLLGLYALWGWWDNKKIGNELQPGEIIANMSNFFKITLVVVIGINLMNVLLTKLASMKIPLVSRVAGTYLPLFSL